MADLEYLRNEVLRFRRELAVAFQESEQVVIELSEAMTSQTVVDFTGARLDFQQANSIRDLFLKTWQVISKEE